MSILAVVISRYFLVFVSKQYEITGANYGINDAIIWPGHIITRASGSAREVRRTSLGIIIFHSQNIII